MPGMPPVELRVEGGTMIHSGVVGTQVGFVTAVDNADNDSLRRRMRLWKRYFNSRHPNDTMATAVVRAEPAMPFFREGPFGDRSIFWMGFSMVLMNTSFIGCHHLTHQWFHQTGQFPDH